MKKILLSVSALAFFLTASSQSTPKKMLLEHFTQASCGPCATYNPAMETLINTTANAAKVVAIKYQTSWPGFDPMNLHNPTDVAARRGVSVYNVTSVPNSVLDGNYYNGHPASWGQSDIDTRSAVMSSFIMDLDANVSSDLSTVTANLKIKASDAISGTFTAHIVVVEKEIAFSSAPGNNGETSFYSVMKKMLPTSSGTLLASTSWAAGDSVMLTESWTMSNVYDKSELAVVAFIQQSTLEVMQATSADAVLPAGLIIADASAVEAHTLPTDFCATSFIPEIEVTNNSNTEIIDTLQVSYVLNGGAPVTQDLFVTINPGANYTHTFSSATLNSGSNTIYYSVNTDQDMSTADIATTNNQTAEENINVISSVAFDTEHQEGFENKILGDISPDNAIRVSPTGVDRAYVVNGTVSTAAQAQLGAHGNSSSCYRWDFPTIASGDESAIIWEKLDFTNNPHFSLTFSYAYAQWANGDDDRLVVSVSTDCGNTWVDEFDEGGSTLKTRSVLSGTRFYPSSSDWLDAEVDLSAYDGNSEVMIKFNGISDIGNCLYVDDINVSQSFTSISDNLENSEAIMIYPNPATTTVSFDFSNLNVNVTNVEILNQLGQVMKNISVTDLTISEDVSDLSSGVYSVKVFSENGSFAPRKLIIK